MVPKIIATLGMVKELNEDKIISLKNAGVDIFRINMSHTTEEALIAYSNMLDNVVDKEHILYDLQGPKIRIGKFKDGFVNIIKSNKLTIRTDIDPEHGDEKEVGVDFSGLHKFLKINDILMLDDGKIVLKVLNVKDSSIECLIVQGGKLSSKKGVNKLGGGISQHSLTDKDVKDIELIAKLDPKMLALSFVSSESDIHDLKNHTKRLNINPKIISKIERKEAVENLQNIIDVSDMLMIARGDLSLEVGITNIPVVQEEIYVKSGTTKVIHATQVLESMIHNPFPTCAEVNDVANAIRHNAYAIMLSAETASGKFPEASVQILRETIDNCHNYFHQ